MQKPLVILVQPKAENYETIYAPLSLLCLATYLKRKYEVRIVDMRISKNYKKELYALLNKQPLAVGITAFTGKQILFGIEVSKYIKEIRPQTYVIWGGIHATILPQQTLRNPFIDIVVKREGEISMFEVLSALQNGASLNNVKGIAYKENGCIYENPDRQFLDVNLLSMPDWDLFDIEPYIRNLSRGKRDRPINITTSRGCPYYCAFCYNLSFNGNTWRCKDALSVAEELKFLAGKYRVNRVIIHDDNFATDKKRALEIAQKIKEEGLKISWSITLRVSDFKKEFLKPLVDGGLYHLRVGAECGSQRLLERIQKDITVEQIIESAYIAKSLGLVTVYAFVLGWPDETEAETGKTLKLAFKLLEINPLANIYPLYIYTPYPGTDLFNEAVKRGFSAPSRLEDWGKMQWNRVNLPWIKDRKRFEAMLTLARFAFYNRKIKGASGGGIAKEPLSFKAFILLLSAMPIRAWARFRLKSKFSKFPYEYLLLNQALRLLKK